MSDDELVKGIGQGDEAAAEMLIRRWYPAVLRYCRWRLGRNGPAEDLTQETFLRLFRSLSCYRRNGKFRAYIFSIANRLCIDEERRAAAASLEDAPTPDAGDGGLRQVEERDELRRLLTGLPPAQREAVLLRFGARLSYPDIARATGCSVRTAQSRVRYALQAMRKKARHD